ncbi:kelch domain-containing protein 10-like [Palaemon carinicauda]|uniref:kelch domain-containing protein 10-like n=1 Tax=Palaemon carinicauda TaxID=392227 RepID=UPI0035B60C62
MNSEVIMEAIPNWSAGSYPVGRSGHRISCTDSFLYTVGGFHPSTGALAEAWRLNISTGEWEQLSNSEDDGTPSTCISHCMASLGQELLIFGGTSYPFGSAMSNEIHACDKATGKWRVVPSEGDIPQEMYGQAFRRMGDYIYTVGGTSGYHFSLQAHALHLPTMTWSCLASSDLYKGNEPSGRYKAEIGVVLGRIVVVGGSSADIVFPLDEVPVLDIEQGKWSLKSTKPDPRFHAYPSPRKCHASVQRGADLYVIGGASGDEVFDDIWKLDLLTLTWSRTCLVLPVPLYFHDAAFSPNGSLFVYGGSTAVGSSERSTAVFRARLQAPPLLEAAWEAFATNCSFDSVEEEQPLDSRTQSLELLAAGVPRRLIQRLRKLPKERRHQ